MTGARVPAIDSRWRNRSSGRIWRVQKIYRSKDGTLMVKYQPGALQSQVCAAAYLLDVCEPVISPADPTFVTTDRGFTIPEPITTSERITVTVHESSAAMGPHIWVKVEDPLGVYNPAHAPMKAVAHLTMEEAARLRDTLDWVIRNHYQHEPVETVPGQADP